MSHAKHIADEHTYSFTCPHCWQSTMLHTDPALYEKTEQVLCDVCHQLIEVHYERDDDGLICVFSAEPA